ncbi:2'-5' RNA ligase family protein [Bacillus sp. NEB1478]|uniref:2'-5' RNA ligase family protein n=1 Tax=Bacillus sp. NEB1478 TaxID=3073816 RepID=UPI002872C55B|nr:2'-5' RNA ligase family protein [Bacillus sp. NEB1478]WNB91272.1 2'-5' RNA ligase family protein [Bacillus sp. NEB1478]
MYAIVANLDQGSDDKICGWREKLKEASVSQYEMKPHVTLATHEELDVKTFQDKMNKYFQRERSIPLFYPSLGMFLNSGTLFLAPTKDRVLTEFHNRYHDHFKEWVNPKSLYAPGQWVPHCTIASHLSHENLVKAFDCCAEWIEPFHGQLVSISLLETHFENGECVEVKYLHTVNLSK